MTNSQRFGGRLLHFWPLSTMNWPEACTARIHVQGKCTCMETNTQIYTHKTSTHTHTRMCIHKQTATHTYTRHTQQRQAIRLHYKKGTAEAEKQVWLFDRLWLLLLQAKNALIKTVRENCSLKKFNFSTFYLLYFLDSPHDSQWEET